MRVLSAWSMVGVLLAGSAMAQAPQRASVEVPAAYARAQGQAIDEAYTALIAKFTTDPTLNSPLTDYLPASDTVSTPLDVLGHIAGGEGYMPYSADVHRYFRELEKASPRVRVFQVGHSEEGRETIAVAIADEAVIANLDANLANLRRLADPRTLDMDQAAAEALVAQTLPVYYITGALHSPETGSPTALMELGYRLAVDEAPYIRGIRSRVITLITPVVEVDGRDRKTDIYNWHLANPGKHYPPLVYWGKYVAHDNNRDGMAMTLNSSRIVLDTYVKFGAQVIHDLHESYSFLYDNTIGTGPYNAWIDPILVGEWQQLGWDNVQQMTRMGLPGVWTHGEFDTWSPGYLMFMAATHNGISRLYETYGNDGADTLQRILQPHEYARTWYRPNPPYPTVLWSARNNNNYQQTGLLTALHYFAENAGSFLGNFHLKSRRSIEKARTSGPAAYVLSADETRPGAQARLLEVMRRQHVEVHRLSSPVTVENPPRRNEAGKDTGDAAGRQRFPAGSYVIRMDQPYSRIADALLDRQYWSPKDSKYDTPYDDTGWSMGDLFNVQLARITDTSILSAPMRRAGDVAVPEGLASIDIPRAASATLPRIALMHTWLSTQTEGWWRMELDRMGIPYAYISTQDISRDPGLRAKYDVILFAPIGRTSTRQIIDGMPMWGDPLPWKTTALTPNLGRIDATDDIRPGMGEAGLANLKAFVREGGLLVTAEDSARFAIDTGLAPGVFVTPTDKLRIVGSVLRSRFVDRAHPVANGYGDEPLAVYSDSGLSFYVADVATPDGRVRGSRWGGPMSAKDFERPTGRGDKQDVDVPQGRAFMDAHPLPDNKPWEPMPLNEEQRRNNHWAIPQAHKPQVVLRFSGADDLLVSGLLDGAGEIAERAAVVNARYGQGSVLLFAINPVWRGSTIGSYRLLFNAILDHGARGGSADR
ncbi:MAG TPA: M14 family zinc carboxypeptidase [Luteimonas sp.]|nr:M14 family zinc carboxypeptidase [Luteimonas sp.]